MAETRAYTGPRRPQVTAPVSPSCPNVIDLHRQRTQRWRPTEQRYRLRSADGNKQYQSMGLVLAEVRYP